MILLVGLTACKEKPKVPLGVALPDSVRAVLQGPAPAKLAARWTLMQDIYR